MTKRETVFSKDLQNKKLTVVRTFDAPLEAVWKAWTESEILDQWWGPKPYRAETKIRDFTEGGLWLYCMVGPTGDRHWCIENFETIRHLQKINNSSSFCDEEGNKNAAMPTMHWKKEFTQADKATEVSIEITFDKDADMETIIQMRFQEGLTAGLSNLDSYLSTGRV